MEGSDGGVGEVEEEVEEVERRVSLGSGVHRCFYLFVYIWVCFSVHPSGLPSVWLSVSLSGCKSSVCQNACFIFNRKWFRLPISLGYIALIYQHNIIKAKLIYQHNIIKAKLVYQHNIIKADR